MKKLFSILLLVVVVVICGAVLPLEADAEEIIDSGICGSNLSWTLDDAGTLTICGTGKMYDEVSWNGKKDAVKIAIIEMGVTSIGSYAFSNCDGLTNVTIPDSVTSIGSYAFSNCDGLTNVTIPDSVTSIGAYAFARCYSLNNVTIPDSVCIIGYAAFWRCESLACVTIPRNITVVESYTFGDCTSLARIEIPTSVQMIDRTAFAECSSLTEIAYSGTSAQWSMISLHADTIPKNATVAFLHGTDNGDSHTWNDGEVTKEATETETGLKKYTCTVCEATKEETLDKLTPPATQPPATQPEPEPTDPATTPTESTTPTAPQQPTDQGSGIPWWTLLIVGIACLAGGCFVGMILGKKKNA